MEAVDILVVDDNESVRRTTAEILRQAGYSVAEAEDGIAALGLLDETHVRVLILDVRMPRLDGIKLIEILEEPPPIIVLSAQVPDTQQLQNSGSILAWLHKPVAPPVLLAAVEQATQS